MSDKAIPVVVVGAAGRMGRQLVAAVARDPGLALVGATEAAGHPRLGEDATGLAGAGRGGVAITDRLEPLLDPRPVVIDFTAPEATIANVELCARKAAAMVIGTTGLSPEQRSTIEKHARAIPCVLAPNMSVGVNLLFHLVTEAARILGPGFDIEIVEAHHRLKKDAPSGTALKLAETAAAARGWDFHRAGRFHRQGMIGERSEEEIGIQTVRGGDIVGEHTVTFAGTGERIELVHRAHSRDTFAQGAMRAVHWLQGRDPGLYDMQDVLGLRQG